MPTDTTVVSPAQDEESDENISLDLHVSDTEDTEDVVPDKNDEEIPMEIEDDILNKFEIKETLRPCDIPGPDENDKHEQEEEKEEEEDKDKEKDEEKETEEEVEKVDVKEDVVDEAKMEEEEATEEKVEDCSEDKPAEDKIEVEEDKGENKTTDQNEEPAAEAVKPPEEADKEAEGDSEDLLTIMEEKTTEADDTEFQNDIEEESKSEDKNENGENSGNNTDENQSDSEGHLQEKDEKATSSAAEENDENGETAMDIEENDLHTEQNDANHDDDDEITVKENDLSQDDLDVTVIENKVSEAETETSEVSKSEEEEDKENKENNADDSGKSVLELILTAKTEGKSGKRLLSDEGSGDESAKKIKLIKPDTEPEKPQDTTVTKLNSFKKFMLDKSLKGITRDQLEMFCIQKMCECIVQKSEIGELKVKVKAQEQMLDCLRKEVVNVSKQARDLNIVHQKVIQDVTRLQENSDKPLIVPKITRSVGLQAVVRNEETKRKTPRPVSVIQSKVMPIRPKPSPNATQSPVRNAATNTGQKQNVIPTTPNARVANKVNNSNSTPNSQKAAPKTPEVNGKGAGVIDLTDEDDKKPAGTPVTTPNGTKVNMINAPNGHKFVLMPNGQTVMVKLATPTTGNVVVTQPLIRTGASPTTNGTIRTNSVLRTVSQPVRAVMASPIRGRAPAPNVTPRQTRPMYRAPQNQKNSRHPAALPNAPAVAIEGAKPVPPKPHLMLNKTNCGTGIVLSWKMPYKLDLYEKIASYQLYAYQETKSEPKTENWGKIGDVKALELPMAVTLTHFAVGNRYFFAVRAVDNLSRPGEFSHYETILL